MAATSKAGAEVTLLLMRANVPNAEVLTAKTERDLGLLAAKYNVDLPRHLAHLPTLPPQRTDSEKAALATASWDPLEKTPIKDRPPRKSNLFLRSASGAGKKILHRVRSFGSPPGSPAK